LNGNLSYRQGCITDLAQMQALAVASYEQYATVLTPDNWQKLHAFLTDEKVFIDLIETSYPFLCISGNTIAGMAFLISSRHPTDIYEAGWCYIRMLGVHPAYTGQGIAKQLITLCIDKAKSLNEKVIALHTAEFMNAARHIYDSIGFTVLKELPLRLGKKYWLYTLDISNHASINQQKLIC
jgi:ribosomal protein S18 acetylase RimI-like enzyme